MPGSKIEDTLDDDDRAALDPGQDAGAKPEPDEEDAPQPEAPAEPADPAPDEPEAKPHEPERVPLAALQDERRKRQELTRKLEELQRQWTVAEQRLQQFFAAQDQNREPPEPEVRIANLEAWQKQQAQERILYEQQQRQHADFMGRYTAAAQEYQAQKPDFMDAYKFLVNSRIHELKTAGYDEATIGQALQQDEMALVGQAFRAERNPAEALYQIAEARGYRPAAAPSPTGANGGQRAASDQIQRMQAASKTRGLDGGDAPKVELDLASLVNMSDAEFAKMARTGKAMDILRKNMA